MNKGGNGSSQRLGSETARIGDFSAKKLEVYVQSNALGNEPHFHVRDAATQGHEFHSCVKIKTAMYFGHSGGIDALDAETRKELFDFLKATPSPKKNVSFASNWEKIIYEWNENNPNMPVDEDAVMPDYTDIMDHLHSNEAEIGVCMEVGGRTEEYFRKHGVHPLANEHVQQVLKMTSGTLELLDDGIHYRRNTGDSGESATKALFGFTDRQTAEDFLSQMDCEIKRHEFNSEALHGSGVEPKDLGYAVSFVDQLTDLYDEEGFRDLTLGLSAELDASIETLERHLTQHAWVKCTLATARFLRESMPGIVPIACHLELHTKAAREE